MADQLFDDRRLDQLSSSEGFDKQLLAESPGRTRRFSPVLEAESGDLLMDTTQILQVRQNRERERF